MQSRYLSPGSILTTGAEEKPLSVGSQTQVEKTTTAVVLKKMNDKLATTPITCHFRSVSGQFENAAGYKE